MKWLVRGLSVALLICTLSFSFAGTASAVVCKPSANPLSCACGAGGGVSGSDTCKATTADPVGGPNGILKKISLVIAFLGGLSAVIVIIIGGFMFVTANGDAQKVASARRAVLGSVIGLIIIAASESIVIFVVNKL